MQELLQKPLKHDFQPFSIYFAEFIDKTKNIIC